MRLVANFWQKISAWWLTIKLLTSLSGFLVWFGWQTYTTSSVLLVSLIWMCLGGLLLMQQLLFWYQPTITHFNPPAFVLAAPVLSKAETRLYTHQSFSNWCHRVFFNFKTTPLIAISELTLAFVRRCFLDQKLRLKLGNKLKIKTQILNYSPLPSRTKAAL
jgi:hypothetical protein